MGSKGLYSTRAKVSATIVPLRMDISLSMAIETCFARTYCNRSVANYCVHIESVQSGDVSRERWTRLQRRTSQSAFDMSLCDNCSAMVHDQRRSHRHFYTSQH